ncbi:MAG: hypothetical protein K0S38_582 [Candidatus Paceibacter sp.]|jgi:hypothetical protein|nr:hypothetical protein [Candidatus Paceibacter sp.]
MEQRSSKIPIVLGIVMIVAIIAGVMYVTTNTSTIISEETENQQSVPPSVNNQKTYSYGDITLSYPMDWKVEENTYYTPVGIGGVVGATFTPPSPKDEEDKINIGGHQVSCLAFDAKITTCKTVADLPIYTASIDPGVLAVFSEMIKTAKISQPEWISWNNPAKNYTMYFNRTMIDKSDANFPAAPGKNLKADVFQFPEAMFASTTIREASVSVVTSEGTTCTSLSEGIPAPETKTKSINGIQFNYYEFIGAAAGNLYTSYEYATSGNNMCYHIVYFVHSVNSGALAMSETEIKILDNKTKEVTQSLRDTFEYMVSTFEFIQ